VDACSLPPPAKDAKKDEKKTKKKLRSAEGPEEWQRGTCLRFKYTPPRGEIQPCVIGRVDGYEWRSAGKILIRIFTGSKTIRYARESMADIEQVDASLLEPVTIAGIKDMERDIANMHRQITKQKERIDGMTEGRKKDNAEKLLLDLESLLDDLKMARKKTINKASNNLKLEVVQTAEETAQECFDQMTSIMEKLQSQFEDVKDVAVSALE